MGFAWFLLRALDAKTITKLWALHAVRETNRGNAMWDALSSVISPVSECRPGVFSKNSEVELQGTLLFTLTKGILALYFLSFYQPHIILPIFSTSGHKR